MDYSLVLFDLAAYLTRVEPVLREFFAGAPEGILLPLLEEANRRSSESETLRKRLLAHNIEPGQSIIRLLTGQAEGGDAFSLEARENRPSLEAYVAGPVVYELLAALCIAEPAGIDPEHSIGESALVSHLIGHSAWIERAFTGEVFGRGEPLRFPLGLQSEIVRREDVQRLIEELKSVPPPDPRQQRRITPRRGTAGLLARMLESQAGRIIPAAEAGTVAGRIANLERMLEASLADRRLAILFTLG